MGNINSIEELLQKEISDNISLTGDKPTIIIMHPITCSELCKQIKRIDPIQDGSNDLKEYYGINIYRSLDVRTNKFIVK